MFLWTKSATPRTRRRHLYFISHLPLPLFLLLALFLLLTLTRLLSP